MLSKMHDRTHQVKSDARQSSIRMRFAAMLNSNRFSLLGVILFAIIFPELLHPYVVSAYPWARSIDPVGRNLFEPSLIASLFALILVQVGLRKTGSLPLIDTKLLVIPTYFASFSLIVIGMALTLRSGERYHLVTSFAIGMAWDFLLVILRGRLSLPRLALAGDTALDEGLLATRIEWVRLHQPRLLGNLNGIVFDSAHELSPAWERLFARATLRNIPVYDLRQLREMTTGRVRLQSRPELVFGQLRPSQPYLRIKRLTDTLAVIPAIALAMPVLLIVGLLIRLDSKGPAVFVQRRVGYQGRIFNCYKLRSMRTELAGAAYTAEGDPRITPIGHFIRKWRIDELPQLFNILKGEMSWIGPRPEAVSLARVYQRDIPYYSYRHAVRPGISGWAAVHQGNVALTEAVTIKLEYDFYYIKYFSIWLDFLIALMTIRTVVTGFGAR